MSEKIIAVDFDEIGDEVPRSLNPSTLEKAKYHKTRFFSVLPTLQGKTFNPLTNERKYGNEKANLHFSDPGNRSNGVRKRV